MKHFLFGAVVGGIGLILYIIGVYVGMHSLPNTTKQIAPQKIEIPKEDVRAPADTYVVYRGNHPPSDTSAMWQDTTNPSNSVFGYTLMTYKDGKWKPVFEKPIYKEDYK